MAEVPGIKAELSYESKTCRLVTAELRLNVSTNEKEAIPPVARKMHHERMSALQNKTKTHKKILKFVTEYRPSVPNLKNILMNKWYLIENQPLLREIFKDPPMISYKKRKALQDILVRAKL